MTFEDKTTTELSEKTLTRGEPQVFVLGLFVAVMSPRCLRAIENARKLCEKYLNGRCELEVIDVYQHPSSVRDAQVIAAPTLVKHPPPLQRSAISLPSNQFGRD